MSLTEKEILDELKARNYKLTSQRRAIVSVFLDHAGQHISAEELYDLVRKENPDIGLATVYRTLELLVELDIVQRINFGDGCDRYELSEILSHQHHHLICTVCGKVQEFGEDLLDDLEEKILTRNGFLILDHEVKFYGVCSECRQNSKSEGEEMP